MKKFPATKIYALAFGLFLGLCLWKFGNPVILDHQITAPISTSELLNDPWPTHWANWILLPLAVLGGWLIISKKKSNLSDKLEMKWLWLLPLAWLGWQFVCATRTVDADLTAATLWQFSGCVAGYFLGAWLFARENLTRWLLVGVLAVFTFCLIRAVDQKLYEYPQNLQLLTEGERCGWTNYPPATVSAMKLAGVIINTNGTDVVNPVILAKFQKGRVSGTLVYPNALAGIILLLWPVALALAFGATKNLKPAIRAAAIALAFFLGGAAFYWSGSKLGWLIGVGMCGLVLLWLNWSKRLKFTAVATVLVLGLEIFTIRFHHYFAGGAPSTGARLDYWRAAVQTTVAQPLFGTGPGTFQRPYAQIKAPTSEMARLAHNDYLEQFSDSGVVGGLLYTAWITLALTVIAKKIYGRQRGAAPANCQLPPNALHFEFAIFMGLLGWFLQGLGEFSLFIPATAWLAFTLLGMLVAVDK